MCKLNMYDNHHEGLLITFCGLDGSGKTSIIHRLMKEPFMQDVLLTKQPTEEMRKSNIFRTYMDNPDHSMYDYRSLSLMAASDRIQHVNKIVVPALEKGRTVICDRYLYSCLANLRARGFNNDEWIYDISKYIVRPNISFFLDIPVETAIKRVRMRPQEKDRYIDENLQYRLRDEYINICRHNAGILVPTDISEDESYMIIKEKVKEVINYER